MFSQIPVIWLATRLSWQEYLSSLWSPLSQSSGVPIRMFQMCLWNGWAHLSRNTCIFLLSGSKPLEWYSHKFQLVIDLGAIDILDGTIHCFEGEEGIALGTMGCTAVSLASTHRIEVATSSFPHQGPCRNSWNCLWTLPDVPWQEKLPLVENHE